MIAFVQNFTPSEKVADYSDTIFGDGAASFYGKPIPISTGTRRLTGVCLWASQFRTFSNKVPSSVPVYFNGKVVGSNNSVLTDPPDTNIYADFAFGFGYRGSESADADTKIKVLRVWANGILIYDKKMSVEDVYNGSTDETLIERFPIDFTVYPGSENQLADPTIVAAEGAQNSPAFRGMIYVVFKDFPISKVGNGMPTIKVEMADRATGGNVISHFNKANPDEKTIGLLVPNWEKGRFTVWTASDAVTYSMTTLREISRSTLDPELAALYNADTEIFDLDAASLATFSYDGRLRTLVRTQSGGFEKTVYLVDFEAGQFYTKIGPVDAYGNTITAYSSAVFTCITANTQDDCIIVLGGRLFGGDELIALRYNPYSETLKFAWGRGANRARGLGPINALTLGNGLSHTQNYVKAVDYWGGAGSNVVWGWTTYDCDGKFNKDGNGVDKTNGLIFQSWYNFATYFDPDYSYTVQAVWRDTTDGNLIVWVNKLRSSPFSNTYFICKIRTGEDLVFAGGYVEILDVDKILWTCDIGSDINGDDAELDYPSRVQTRYLLSRSSLIAWVAGPNYYVLNTVSGTCEVHSSNSAVSQSDGTFFPGGLNQNGSHADPATDAIYIVSQTGTSTILNRKYAPARMLIDQTFTDRVPLANLLHWYGRAAGYTDDQIEISGINDEITGAIITQRTSISDLFGQLKGAFNFDKYESGGKIRLTRNVPGETVVFDAELDGERLAAVDGEGGGSYLTTTVRDERDIPAGVEIKYLDEDADYAIGVQRAKRTKFPIATTESDEFTSYAVPVIMKAGEALGYANRALWAFASERLSQNFRYPWELINLEPSRIISLSQNERQYALKISEVMINGDYTLSVVARTLAITVDRDYVASLPIRPPLGIGYEGYNIPIIMDAPGVEGDYAGANLVYGYAAGPQDEAATWRGATVYDVTTGAQIVLSKVIPTPTRGFVKAAFDEFAEAITFKLLIGNASQFLVQTDEEALSGERLIAVGQAGRWELMSWRTVSFDEGSQLLTLAGLVRGFRGTDAYAATHRSSDQVILFSASDYELIEVPSEALGSTRKYAAARTIGGLAGAPVVSYQISGAGLAPFSPAAFQAHYIGSDIVFDWQRRDRLNENDFLDGSDDVVNSEGFEGYRIRIFGNDGNILRENDMITTNTYTYLNADIISDFGVMPTVVTASVEQKGARVPFGIPNKRTMAIYT